MFNRPDRTDHPVNGDPLPTLPHGWRLLVGSDMAEVERVEVGGDRECVALVRKRPGRLTTNEDSVLIAPLDDERIIIAVADGAGGLPEGAHASALAVSRLASALVDADAESTLRTRILAGLLGAHHAIAGLRCGAATTANVVYVERDKMWSYHIGDSMTLVVDGDGRCKFRTVPHSPVGQQVSSGALSDEQAIHHADLHLVSRLLGVGEAFLDESDPITLAVGDTVVVASDGLFDNLLTREVMAVVRRSTLRHGADQIAVEAWRRMTRPEIDDPCKPDDLAMVFLRRC